MALIREEFRLRSTPSTLLLTFRVLVNSLPQV
jgi:hypothetical protein